MQFRMGINLGEVTEVGDKIYGNAVNVAARLEGLAIPGSICISETVYNIVKKKLPLNYECLVDQALENITGSMPAYPIREHHHLRRARLRPHRNPNGDGMLPA